MITWGELKAEIDKHIPDDDQIVRIDLRFSKTDLFNPEKTDLRIESQHNGVQIYTGLHDDGQD